MNCLLLDSADFHGKDESRVRVDGRRWKHIREIHRAKVGDEVLVGRVNGRMGMGQIVSMDTHCLELEVQLDRDPPAPLPLILVLALPRPRVLGRVLIAASSMGIKEFHLIHTRKVEKTFWNSHVLDTANLERQLRLGLELAKDTGLPRVALHRRFRPFVEEVLPTLAVGRRALVAHPGARSAFPRGGSERSLLVVGPEGGLLPRELEDFSSAGLEVVGLDGALAERVLNVETAVTALVSRLF